MMPADIRELATLVRDRAAGDRRILHLAAALDEASVAEKPGDALARHLGISTPRAPHLARRDAALVELSRHADFRGMRLIAQAKAIERQFVRYFCGAWRLDSDKSASPYGARAARHLLWLALRAHPQPPGWRTIRRAVERVENDIGALTMNSPDDGGATPCESPQDDRQPSPARSPRSAA